MLLTSMGTLSFASTYDSINLRVGGNVDAAISPRVDCLPSLASTSC